MRRARKMRDFWCRQLNIIFTTCCDATLLVKIIWDTFIKWGWLVGDQALVLTHVGPSVHYLGATCGLDIRLHRALLAKWPCPKPLWAPPELSFVFEHSSTPQKKTDFHPPLQALSKLFQPQLRIFDRDLALKVRTLRKVSNTQIQRLNTTVFLCLVGPRCFVCSRPPKYMVNMVKPFIPPVTDGRT